MPRGRHRVRCGMGNRLVTATQGSGRSAQQIADEVTRRKRIQEKQLPSTRARATSWARGVGVLLLVSLSFSLVKGRSDISTLAPYFAWSVGAMLVVAVIAAAVAAYFLFRAAYGPLTPQPPEKSDRELAIETMRDLRTGLRIACFGVAVLLAGVAITWYGPAADGPKLQIVNSNGSVSCGKPTRVANGAVTLTSGARKVSVDLERVARLIPVDTCPEP